MEETSDDAVGDKGTRGGQPEGHWMLPGYRMVVCTEGPTCMVVMDQLLSQKSQRHLHSRLLEHVH